MTQEVAERTIKRVSGSEGEYGAGGCAVSVADTRPGLGGGWRLARGSQACRCAQGVEHLGSDEAIFL
ncbi:hypothetical protein E2C01_062306 [Portunus trituberculatus]|uniref:Uncharacterized protein n=1 Tax=Portunus trituberculatus TaxID=210409 RepID=A0A5B7HDA0_PORTR|nr:hypothetical protein [Portunus trituberculatus]